MGLGDNGAGVPMRTLGLYTAYAGGVLSLAAIFTVGTWMILDVATGYAPSSGFQVLVLIEGVAGLALTIIGACLYIAGWKGR